MGNEDEPKGTYFDSFYETERREALLREAGAKKYSTWNWRKGIPIAVALDSAKRHLNKALAGWNDEDHLIQARWNLGVAIEMIALVERGKLPKEIICADLVDQTPPEIECHPFWVDQHAPEK
jgi:hypothetical protein